MRVRLRRPHGGPSWPVPAVQDTRVYEGRRDDALGHAADNIAAVFPGAQLGALPEEVDDRIKAVIDKSR